MVGVKPDLIELIRKGIEGLDEVIALETIREDEGGRFNATKEDTSIHELKSDDTIE